MRIEDIEIHAGEPTFGYSPLRRLEAKVEATTVFQSAPTVDEANSRLRAMAAKLGANAVINVRYDSGVSMTSWRSMKATGLAVVRESDEIVCPQCAETIKRAAKVCRYCGADVSAMTVEPSSASKDQPAATEPAPVNHQYQEPLRETNNPQLWLWLVGGMFILFTIIGAAGS
jgi:hypothetical protein